MPPSPDNNDRDYHATYVLLESMKWVSPDPYNTQNTLPYWVHRWSVSSRIIVRCSILPIFSKEFRNYLLLRDVFTPSALQHRKVTDDTPHITTNQFSMNTDDAFDTAIQPSLQPEPLVIADSSGKFVGSISKLEAQPGIVAVQAVFGEFIAAGTAGRLLGSRACGLVAYRTE